MIPYLQLEMRTAATQVAPNAAVVFDTSLLNNGSDISYNNSTGVITFSMVGVYYLNWFVAQQTGLAVDGSNFAIVASDDADGFPGIRGSAHVKISQTSGFAVIDVATAGKSVRLVNKSGFGATLSQAAQVKAGLAVFALTDSVAPSALGYAQAQLSESEAANLSPIADGTPVIFDEIIVADQNDIVEYDNVTGIFTLNSAGTYLVTWEIPVSATDANDYVYMSLLVDGDEYSVCHMPLPIGVLSGSAVVAIELDETTTIATLQLVNSSGDLVEITDLCNMVVTQISAM